MSVTKQCKIGENMIKCGMFFKNSFVTGSTDNFLRITKYKGKSFFNLFFIIKFIFLCLVILRIYCLTMSNVH